MPRSSPVRRACGAVSSGTCSAKVFFSHPGLSQKNRRTYEHQLRPLRRRSAHRPASADTGNGPAARGCSTSSTRPPRPGPARTSAPTPPRARRPRPRHPKGAATEDQDPMSVIIALQAPPTRATRRAAPSRKVRQSQIRLAPSVVGNAVDASSAARRERCGARAPRPRRRDPWCGVAFTRRHRLRGRSMLATQHCRPPGGPARDSRADPARPHRTVGVGRTRWSAPARSAPP